jgi:hypothetical protein
VACGSSVCYLGCVVVWLVVIPVVIWAELSWLVVLLVVTWAGVDV